MKIHTIAVESDVDSDVLFVGEDGGANTFGLWFSISCLPLQKVESIDILLVEKTRRLCDGLCPTMELLPLVLLCCINGQYINCKFIDAR
jgi:hypothetical protein